MPLPNKKYDANFTAGGILFNEFKSFEAVLLSSNFDELAELEKDQNKFIGISTNSARKRIITEIKRRNKSAPKNFWENFFSWHQEEQRLALFYLCLKTYPLIMDLHIEVALKKYRVGSKLEAYDIQMRFEEIMSYDDVVASWSLSTIKRLNMQYRKALRDSGLYDAHKVLKKPSKPSNQFWDYFKNINEHWFLEACFKDKN
jgi:hypothetical protein